MAIYRERQGLSKLGQLKANNPRPRGLNIDKGSVKLDWEWINIS